MGAGDLNRNPGAISDYPLGTKRSSANLPPAFYEKGGIPARSNGSFRPRSELHDVFSSDYCCYPHWVRAAVVGHIAAPHGASDAR